MKIATILLNAALLFLFNDSASAHIDYGMTTLMRTYSPGLSVNPSIGFNQLLWGDPATPMFGYLRPYALGVISPSVYEGKVGLEIFPISILGIDLRRAYGRRFNDTKNQNCDVLECQGPLPYTDISVQSFFGFKEFFASIRFTRTYFDGNDSRSFPVYELGSAVILDPKGDRGDYWQVAIGKNLGGPLRGVSTGILAQNNEFRELRQHMHAIYGFAAFDISLRHGEGQSAETRFPAAGSSKLTVGIGAFRSSRNVGESSIVVAYSYSPRSALGFGR